MSRILEPDKFKTEYLLAKVSKKNCPQISDCNSCDYKNITYKESLEQKLAELDRLLSIKPMIVPSIPFNYRKRAQFHIKNSKLGYYKQGTHDLIEIKYCPLLVDKINEFLGKQHYLADGKLELELSNNKLSERFIEERGNQFSQVNDYINNLMKEHIYKLVSKLKPSSILELYGGNGNFIESLYNEPYIKKILSVDFATTNRILLDGKVRFISQNVDNFLKGYEEHTDLILLDPPRRGINPKNFKKILMIAPKYIIYISCNQKVLAQDVKFLKANGFLHQETLLFDMFPFTKHLESVNFFIKI